MRSPWALGRANPAASTLDSDSMLVLWWLLACALSGVAVLCRGFVLRTSSKEQVGAASDECFGVGDREDWLVVKNTAVFRSALPQFRYRSRTSLLSRASLIGACKLLQPSRPLRRATGEVVALGEPIGNTPHFYARREMEGFSKAGKFPTYTVHITPLSSAAAGGTAAPRSGSAP